MVEGLKSRAFVGRDRELARLVGAFETAQDAEGRTVVIGGEAGIGKSRLVEALIDAVRDRGATVLAGACLPTGSGATPYAPFVEALRAFSRSVEPARLPALLGSARDEIGRLLPDVAAQGSTHPDRLERDRAGQSRLFEAILSVIERAGRSATVVLAVEDIQWADDGTRGLLTFLSRNLRQAPALILVTVRTDDLHADVAIMPFLAELERDAWVERIELEPLDRADVLALVRGSVGGRASSDQVESIVARSGGNPFLVEQLTDPDLADRRLPPRLRDILAARLADLPDGTRRVIRAAAAAGRRVDEDILAAALGMSAAAVVEALRPAIVSGILVDADGDGAGGGYRFRHELLAEVADGELLDSERVRLHAAFALELERRAAVAGSPVAAAEVAHHWVVAREPERAVPALLAAGQAAQLVYAFSEARQQDELALELWDPGRASYGLPDGSSVDRVTLLQRAAESAVLSGAYPRAVTLGREAIVAAQIAEVVDQRPDPARIGALHDRMRWYLWESGDREAAVAAVDEALRIIPETPSSSLRARVLGQAAGLRLFNRDPVAAGNLAREAVDVARAAASLADEAFGLGILGWSEAVTGDVDRGIATYRAALGIAERLGSVEGIALGHANLAALLDQVGRTSESLDAARDGFAVAQRLGVTRTYGGGLLGDAAKALFDLGRWDEAAATADQGLDLDPLGSAASWLHVNRARVDTNQGRFDQAEAHLQRAGELAGSGQARYRGAIFGAVVELAALRGRLVAVRATLDQAIAAEGSTLVFDPAIGWLVWYALRAEADAAVTARANRDETAIATVSARAGALAAELEKAAATPGWGGALHLRGVIGLCRGELDRIGDASDPEAWDRVGAIWEELGRPALVSYARYRSAEATLGRRGDRSAAAAALRVAHDIARRLGAAPLLAEQERLGRHARIDLARGGGDHEEADDDPLGLTRREAEVIRLVATGRSNQQIADELYITRKTASVHVSNILGKLGVANRVEAAAIAQRLGLDKGKGGP